MFSRIFALLISVCLLMTSMPINDVINGVGDIVGSLSTSDNLSVEDVDKSTKKEFTVKEDVEVESQAESLSVTVATVPILPLKSGTDFINGTPVTVTSNYPLDSLSIAANSGAKMSSTYTLTTEGQGITARYIYKYTITGGTYSGTSAVTFTATYTYNSTTSTAKTTAKVLKSPISANSLGFEFSLSYKRQDSWGSVNSNPVLKYSLAVSGLHKVSTASVFKKSGSLKSSENADLNNWELNYGDVSSTYNGRFYYDTNSSNTIGASYGATTLSTVRFSIYNPTNVMGEDGIPERKEVRFSANYDEYMRPDTGETYKSIDLLTMDTPGTVNYALSSAPYSSRNSNGIDTVKYSTIGYAHCNTASSSIYASYTFSITYEWVNSTKLWNIYKSESNLNRFAYTSLYKEADSDAWADYIEAYTNATTILAGGYSQKQINTAADALIDAVSNLKTKVIYDKNSGSGNCEDYSYVNVYSDVSVTADKIQTPVYIYNVAQLESYSELSKKGYRCIGWSTSSTATQGFDFLTITEAQTKVPVVVYAVWSPASYTVVYNVNKPVGVATSVGTMSPQACVYDETYIYSENKFIITNYVFAGWNTSPDGSGTMTQPGESFKNLTPDNETINLYAIWKTDAVSVIFNINLPSGVTSTTSGLTENKTEGFDIGATVDLSNYSMDSIGYKHIGWSTQMSATTPTYTTTFTVPQATITLYAVWQKKSVTITYALNGGQLSEGNYTENDAVVEFGEIVDLPNVIEATRSGYRLAGWKSSIDGKTYSGSFAVPDTNSTSVILTAEWVYRTTSIRLHQNNVELSDPITTITGTYTSPFDKTLITNPEVTDHVSGCEFMGWYIKDGNGYKLYEAPATFPAEDVDLYAGWKLVELAEVMTTLPSDFYDEVNGDPYYYYPQDEKNDVLSALADAESVYGETGIIYNSKDLRIANLTQQILEISLAVLDYNPPDFSAFTSEMQRTAEIIEIDTKVYDDTYKRRVVSALNNVERGKNNSSLTIKDDQALVDRWISNLKTLVDNPVYKTYSLTFHYNGDVANDVINTVSVPCKESIAVAAPADPQREGYNFIGWYTTAKDTSTVVGRKIDFETTTEEMGTANRDVYARWEIAYGGFVLEVKGTNATINVAFNENELTNKGAAYVNDNVLRGTSVLLSAEAEKAGAEFLYWSDGNGRIVSTKAEYVFVLVADTKLEAVYSEGFNRETYKVIYVDGVTNKVLETKIVDANTEAPAPTLINHIGYKFTGYSESLKITKDTVIFAEYEESDETYSVRVKNDIGTLNPTGEYKYNSKVTVSLKETGIPAGKFFAGWSFDGGNTIVSYEMSYTFYVYTDTEIEAVFANVKTNKESTVTIATIDKTNSTVAFMVSREIAEDEFFLTSGILVTKDAGNSTEETLTLDNESENEAIKNFTTLKNDKVGQYKLTVSSGTPGAEYYARGYIVYRDAVGKICVKYTDIVKVTF